MSLIFFKGCLCLCDWTLCRNIVNPDFVVFILQGANASALEKEIGPEQFPVNEHYFGLVNVSIKDTQP